MDVKRRKISKAKRRRVYARDRYICRLCGLSCPLEEATIDHVIPVSKGGTNDIENLVTAHERCNHKKDDREYIRVRKLNRVSKRRPSMDDAEARAAGLD